MRYRIWALLLFAPLAVALADDKKPEGDKKKPEKKPAEIALAVIVNEKNPVKKISFSELRSYMKMRRQFWPNRKRCDLYLPKRASDTYKILLKKVYKTTDKKLQKYWVRLLFAGDIPAKPSVVTSPKAAGTQVKKNEGALSVVPANQVPKGVRVLPIDGKKPGDKGYPLIGKP
ncbi:MAG: type 2 periplasmic-binding domain-containing protein [Planctomycetota bacterium]|jgi:hypothetical protein